MIMVKNRTRGHCGAASGPAARSKIRRSVVTPGSGDVAFRVMQMRKLQIALMLVLLFAGASQAGRLALGSRYKDESNGFKLQLPRNWEQVPTKFQDVATVGKWSGSSRDWRKEPPGLVVLRFMQAPAEEAQTPGDALRNRTTPGYRGMLRYQPKDIWECANRIVGQKPEVLKDEPEFKMTSKKVKAHLKVLRSKLSDRVKKQVKER